MSSEVMERTIARLVQAAMKELEEDNKPQALTHLPLALGLLGGPLEVRVGDNSSNK